ncbi:DUF3352 domain-containing protein [Nocardioides sp.]|uniref:DUF3352 domain-containing protein n=1 Tax=Nocardioides sp. TaxID=35761 RepID=UPI002BE45373|nr:DUF3352 domain-containing protein [Nocardioides sp.]HXH78072.1 DUF3352 domain-containing protein [Nocardioides sp.]
MSNTTPPSSGGPEYLESSAGSPVEREGTSADRRKRIIALGGLAGVLALGGGAVWAATSFLGTGAQPAEALPAGTLGYVSVDLDPSGDQKVEAIQTLRKFPAFKDEINLDTDDDLRERLFEEITDSGECEGLDYKADVEPWLGSRAALAAVDTGDDAPSPVGVVQVTDAGGAEDGLAKLVETCGGSDETSTGGWVVAGDWVVIAETEAIAQKVVDATEKGALADDDAFAKWTGEAGADGIMSFYVAAEAADYLGQVLASPGMGMLAGMGAAPLTALPPGAEGMDENGEVTEPMPTEVPEELQEMLDNFDGAAATVRFEDGALEVEYAASNYQPELSKHFTNEAGVELIGGLPDDTVAAFALGFEPGWVDGMIDYFASVMPESDGMSVDELIAEAETATGLELPEDAETLMGEGIAVSLGGGIDVDAFTNGGPGELPLGVTIDGDADDIQAVLDKMKDAAGPEVAPYLEATEVDGHAVIALNDDYRGKLDSGGSLGDTDVYADVVEGDEAQSVMFVNFNADDDWLTRVVEDDPETSENLDPLAAFGVSQWIDGDTMHGLFKLTTD